jgi:predicted membrane protein
MAEFDPNRFGERIKEQVHERIQESVERRARRRSGFGGLVIGSILAGIGALLLLQNLGILYVHDLWEWWPLILIALGISRAASAYGFGGRIWGGVMVLAGALFLLHNLGFIHGDPWVFFWPIALISIGVGMLARNLDRQQSWSKSGPVSANTSGSTVANTVSEWAIFGGVKRRIDSQDFEGGEALAIFGGIKIDLRKAATKKEEMIFEANALFGGIEMRVPEAWESMIRGAGIFGAYEDKTDPAPIDPKRPRLVITGYAVFGGIEVKN